MTKKSSTPRSRRIDIVLQAVLVLLNVVAFNVLVRPAHARLDLTQEKLYTLTDVTRKTLADLPDRVDLFGYFTPDAHPKLSPFIPKIRDLCEEMRQASGGKLIVNFVDPKADPEVEKEANRRFNVRPSAFPLASATESGIKNAYYDIVVSYGDQFERLGWQDLVEIRPSPAQDDVEVRLRNLEFAIVNAITKITREFGSLEARLLEQKAPAKVSFFLSAPDAAPEADKQAREFLEKRATIVQSVVDDLQKRYKAGLQVTLFHPEKQKQDAACGAAMERYGVQGLRFSMRSDATYFVEGWVEIGDKATQVDLRDHPDHELSQADVTGQVEGAMRRLLPGAMKKIGLVTPHGGLTPEQIMMMQRGMQPPKEDPFQALRQALSHDYEVTDANLSSGKPPLDVDLLCILRPTELDAKARFALDQYLMFGGKAIICADRAELDLDGMRYGGGIKLKPVETGLDDLFRHWGVAVEKELVLDDSQFPLTFPVQRDIGGGLMVEELQRVPYPFFPLAKGDAIDRTNPVVGKVDRLAFLWPSPLAIDAERTKGLKVSTLVRTSPRAWTSVDMHSVEPKAPTPDGKPGYVVPEKTQSYPLAVALEGSFTSAFDAKSAPTGTATPQGGLEPLSKSPATTRLVIVGNATFLSDLAPRVVMDQQFNKGVEFFTNLCDWALLDDALIQIRGRGALDRSLKTLDKAAKERIDALNLAVPAALVILVGLLRAASRKRAKRRVRA